MYRCSCSTMPWIRNVRLVRDSGSMAKPDPQDLISSGLTDFELTSGPTREVVRCFDKYSHAVSQF